MLTVGGVSSDIYHQTLYCPYTACTYSNHLNREIWIDTLLSTTTGIMRTVLKAREQAAELLHHIPGHHVISLQSSPNNSPLAAVHGKMKPPPDAALSDPYMYPSYRLSSCASYLAQRGIAKERALPLLTSFKISCASSTAVSHDEAVLIPTTESNPTSWSSSFKLFATKPF